MRVGLVGKLWVEASSQVHMEAIPLVHPYVTMFARSISSAQEALSTGLSAIRQSQTELRFRTSTLASRPPISAITPDCSTLCSSLPAAWASSTQLFLKRCLNTEWPSTESPRQ